MSRHRPGGTAREGLPLGHLLSAYRGQRSVNGSSSDAGDAGEASADAGDAGGASAASCAGGSIGSARGHSKLDLFMPGRPWYQHCLPSTMRHDQYPVRAVGNSALHSTELFAAAPDSTTTMAAARICFMTSKLCPSKTGGFWQSIGLFDGHILVLGQFH